MYTSPPPPPKKNGKEIFKVPSRTDVGSQSTGIDSFWNTHRREGFGSKLSPLPFHSVHTPHINLSTSYLSPAMCTIVGGWKRTPPSPKKKYNNRRNLNYAGRRPPPHYSYKYDRRKGSMPLGIILLPIEPHTSSLCVYATYTVRFLWKKTTVRIPPLLFLVCRVYLTSCQAVFIVGLR